MLNVISLERALQIAAHEMCCAPKTLRLPLDEAAGLVLAIVGARQSLPM